MLKIWVRPLLILIPLLLGLGFPAARRLAEPPWNIVRYSLMLMVFSSCLSLSFRDLKLRYEHFRVTAVNLLLGIVPWGLCRWLFPEQPYLAATAFWVGIAPTAAAAPAMVSFLNGRTGFALTGFVFDTCCVALALLLLLPVAVGEFSAAFVMQVGQTLGWVLLVPFGAAMAVRRLKPDIGALSRRLRWAVLLLWSGALFVLAATARQYFADHPETSVMAFWATAGLSLVMCILNFSIGRQLSAGRYRRECSQLLGQKNTSLMICLALQFAGAMAALGPVFYILWHNTWNAWQMYRCDRHRFRHGRHH